MLRNIYILQLLMMKLQKTEKKNDLKETLDVGEKTSDAGKEMAKVKKTQNLRRKLDSGNSKSRGKPNLEKQLNLGGNKSGENQIQGETKSRGETRSREENRLKKQ